MWSFSGTDSRNVKFFENSAITRTLTDVPASVSAPSGILSRGAALVLHIRPLQGRHPSDPISRASASWGLRWIARWKRLSS